MGLQESIRWALSVGAGAGFGLLSTTVEADTSASSPMGIWSRGDGKAQVRIEPCEKGICAVNTWIRPGVTDEKVGDRLVMTVTPSGPSTWSGEAFDPQRNLTFRIRIDAGEREMTTHGCFLAGLLCKDMNWTRIQTVAN